MGKNKRQIGSFGDYVITIIIFLFIMWWLYPSAYGQTPIDYNKWQHDDSSFSMQFGAQLQNYQKLDGSWDKINNTFLVDGDSAYCHTAILNTKVFANGKATTRLRFNDTTYEITKRPVKLIWLNSETKIPTDVIPNLTWPEPTIFGNEVNWDFPGFSYTIIKKTATVSHRFTYKDVFLDSAIILYNQREDSANIYLGNVMEYSFMNIDDSTLTDVTEVSWKRLKRFGKVIFDISKQRLHFSGEDTIFYELIPIKQRWRKQGGKIYCIELIKMSKMKALTEAFTDIDVWHNAQDSFSIDTVTAAIDNTWIWEFASAQGRNYGADATFGIGDVFVPQSRIKHALFNFPTLADSMTALGGGITYDSAKIRTFTNSVTIEANETLFVTVHKVTSLWDEGDLDDIDAGAGVTYDSASQTGTSGGSNPNAPQSWATNPDFASDDYAATEETQVGGLGDSVVFPGDGAGVIGANEEVYFRIGSATITDGLGEGIYLKPARISTADNDCNITFDSDDAIAEADRPWLEVFYTTGAPAPTPKGRRKKFNSINN